jgi:soluble lytic murein transglycosylase
MHAALGFALATGDMRGILALAYEIPGSGLTQEEKRRFLYPLPAEGPIQQAILAAKTEPALILAVARNESLFEPAVRSRAGALGWMQIMPFHFQDRGAKPGHEHWAMPAVSIGKGDQLLEENRRRYDGDPYLTLAAYNAGPGAADRWLRQLGGEATPEIYLAWIGYTETRRYVEKVLIDREIYDWILTGQP